MKLTLTGATGFVGVNLKRYLNKILTIQSLSRTELNESNPEMLNGSKAIVHLAGKAHDLKKVSSPDAYYEVNHELTKKLYDSFLKSDASIFIFISSVKAAADKVEGILTENEVPVPETHYGKSKFMAEQYITNQPLPPGKSYFILRPCMIHGEGNKGNLNLLYQIIRKGIPYPLGAFDNKRSFLSVENLCFVIQELILQRDIPSGIYNVADDEPLSTNEVVTILSASLNKKPRLWHIPANLIRFIANVGDKLLLPLNTERLDKLTESYVVSNDKLRKALNKQLPLSSKEGLKITALSFLKS
ncbi:NAD-dependent epimerase/dehydratase family protein [Pedobacter cryoconitis]|uniref:NAD-dependent epimerase/dehydratase family protein n=1 Tax=Pedobacter cryoconitis TaxID=188932 RepID=UPI0016225969|nr:NAD-dependent epimerase/dehydratase family protein [Pedobacter cryoconitis]MBB5647471.1 nucleoside-diphosphate-sugar epimerase [Pedobacter cryoconitis]